jgi:hypothetical protein
MEAAGVHNQRAGIRKYLQQKASTAGTCCPLLCEPHQPHLYDLLDFRDVVHEHVFDAAL